MTNMSIDKIAKTINTMTLLYQSDTLIRESQ
jgi:hypothetical protein